MNDPLSSLGDNFHTRLLRHSFAFSLLNYLYCLKKLSFADLLHSVITLITDSISGDLGGW